MKNRLFEIKERRAAIAASELPNSTLQTIEDLVHRYIEFGENEVCYQFTGWNLCVFNDTKMASMRRDYFNWYLAIS